MVSWSRRCAVHGLVVAVLTFFVAAFFALWVWKMLACGVKRPQIIPVLNLPLWYAQAPLALDRREQPPDGAGTVHGLPHRARLGPLGGGSGAADWWGSWRDR